MTTVQDILKFIEGIAPPYMKESWDNVGLNCGRRDRQVRKILVALDPFAPVCQEAVTWGADLLVTHHALIWKPGFVTDQSEWGKNALYLIENGIAHINAHTNLDCAPGGVNDRLAQVLGLDEIQVIEPKGTDQEGRPWGLLRQGMVQEQNLTAFLSSVKERLGSEGLRYVDSGKPVRYVAVGGGACASEFMAAVRAGCDTFVTADVKYNQFYDAQCAGLNLIDAGHFHTENPVVALLAEKISAAFPEIQVEISKNHGDSMKFY
jgi:dinuclear metal center YbgI/SA1388 family protein